MHMKFERNKTWELDHSASITPQITRILRERIIQSDLQPGDRISETEVAGTYNISRQPVREAFIKLADQGLLEIRPQRGTIVTRIGYFAVLDARFLREAIEADICKILAANPDPGLITHLRRQLEVQQALEPEDADGFIRLDERFHRSLAEAAGKASAWRQIEGLKSQMDRVRYLSLREFRVDKLIAQHGSIVDRIEACDVSGTNHQIRMHLREVLKDLPQIIKANDRFFDLPDGDIPPPVNAPMGGTNT